MQLDTLGDDVHAEIVRERNNRPQDDWPRAFGRRAHKRLVDFDRVERETLEVGKRRITSAEVIERQTGAEFATNPLQHLRCVLRILHRDRLGKLEFERSSRQRSSGQHRAQILDQVMTQQLTRRHVDAGEQRIARCRTALPSAELPRGAVQDRKAEFDDEPCLLGDGDKFGRRHRPQLG